MKSDDFSSSNSDEFKAKQLKKEKRCKNCGHTIQRHSTDDCNEFIKKGKAYFVCNCQRFEGE